MDRPLPVVAAIPGLFVANATYAVLRDSRRGAVREVSVTARPNATQSTGVSDAINVLNMGL